VEKFDVTFGFPVPARELELEQVIAYNLYRVIVKINVCTDFKLLEVKVPLMFLGPVGFSTCRDGRYI